MPETLYLSTAQVARVLGVSVTTVKRWVDDGILPARKTAGGHRKLLRADVLRLSRDGQFPDLNWGPLTATSEGEVDPAALRDQLLPALRAGNEDTVRSLIRTAYFAGLPMGELADRVLAPCLTQIGHDWTAGRLDILHEHRGTQQVAAALYELKGMLDSQTRTDRPRAVGGAPEADHYFLPSLLAQLVLLDAGWEAVNLGANTPMVSFREALTQLRPRLLWVSVSHLQTPDQFLAGYQEMAAEAQRHGVALAVGGRGLTAELRTAMSYTTYGDGLTHLAAFAHSLCPLPRRPRRGRPPRNGTSTPG